MASVALRYSDNGAGATPAYVFIHGWTCNRSFFAPQYEYFGRSNRAVAVDLRGHGDSPVVVDGDYSIDAFAGDVASLLDGLELRDCVVVGHSLGGVVTCALAATRPDLVACAVMVDPAPFVVRDGTRAAVIAFLARVASPDGRNAREDMVKAMFLPTDDPARTAEITQAMGAVPHEIAGPAIGGLVGLDGPALLRAVRCPIAAIVANTSYNDLAAMKQLNDGFTSSQTLGSGHFNQLEVPEQVNAMIDRFVRIST